MTRTLTHNRGADRRGWHRAHVWEEVKSNHTARELERSGSHYRRLEATIEFFSSLRSVLEYFVRGFCFELFPQAARTLPLGPCGHKQLLEETLRMSIQQTTPGVGSLSTRYGYWRVMLFIVSTRSFPRPHNARGGGVPGHLFLGGFSLQALHWTFY